ncbi:hypothetical protein M413DRAFT_270639 [Hebeloma cylindrosporum]|uniref:Uncharacterized protein n=1 Tax=Hebeloma cylindrosporum TaxID=76867 RepID=A0A0C2Z1V6_HEBCY|nr:hypothetical protein M413DRAFT_270639 [Hebeloma cylindrosporum h7]
MNRPNGTTASLTILESILQKTSRKDWVFGEDDDLPCQHGEFYPDLLFIYIQNFDPFHSDSFRTFPRMTSLSNSQASFMKRKEEPPILSAFKCMLQPESWPWLVTRVFVAE